MKRNSISVVIPIFRSSQTLQELYRRLEIILSSLTHTWEIILIDDASNDGTFDNMLALHHHDKRVKLIRFAKNMGQHHATLCGLQHATGDYTITLDDDLQNPPEEIPKFLTKIDEGYDVVMGRAAAQKQHHWARNVASKIMRFFQSVLLNKPRKITVSSFKCMTKRATQAIACFTNTHVYLPALIFTNIPPEKITNILIDHCQRKEGKSHYTTRKLLKLSSYLLINYSRLPLRFMTIWGTLLSIGSIGYALFTIIRVLLDGTSASGWPSLAVLISFLSGNILLCMGVLGEYIGRLMDENSRASQFPVFEEYL